MTPETAQALEPGTTPGPWEAYDPGDGTARMYAGEVEEARPLLHGIGDPGYTSCVYFTRQDGELIAAAPDMLATIAAQTWEYAVEVRPDEDSEWQHTGPWWPTVEKARAWRGRAVICIGQPYTHDRLVCRLVGPIEPIDKEVP